MWYDSGVVYIACALQDTRNWWYPPQKQSVQPEGFNIYCCSYFLIRNVFARGRPSKSRTLFHSWRSDRSTAIIVYSAGYVMYACMYITGRVFFLFLVVPAAVLNCTWIENAALKIFLKHDRTRYKICIFNNYNEESIVIVRKLILCSTCLFSIFNRKSV